jgi:hypothetical protein
MSFKKKVKKLKNKVKKVLKKTEQSVRKPVKKILKITKKVIKNPLKAIVKVHREIIFKPTEKFLKEIKKGLKKTEQKLRKPVKKALKSLEKTLKEAAIPITITILTGGTGITYILVSTAATRAATKKINNPYVKTVLGVVINGSITNSGKILQDSIKSLAALKVARETKNSVAAALVLAALNGDIKNVHDAGKIITREVVKERVAKKVLKKTNNVLLSQAAGTLSSMGAQNLYGQVRMNYQKIEQQRQEQQRQDQERQEQQRQEQQRLKQQEQQKKIIIPKEENIIKSDNDLFSEPSKMVIVTHPENKVSIKELDTELSEPSKMIIVTHPENKVSIKELDTELSVSLNLDSVKPNISASKSYGNDSVNGTVTVSNENIEVSSNMKLNERTSVGNNVNVTKNSLSYGTSVKNNNVENSYSIAVRKDGFWNSEVGVEHSRTTTHNTNVQGVCVSKTTYKQEIRVPLCGKVGTVEQIVTTCPGKITVTNYKGFNTKGAVCGGAVATATVISAPVVVTAAEVLGTEVLITATTATVVPVLITAE